MERECEGEGTRGERWRLVRCEAFLPFFMRAGCIDSCLVDSSNHALLRPHCSTLTIAEACCDNGFLKRQTLDRVSAQPVFVYCSPLFAQRKTHNADTGEK